MLTRLEVDGFKNLLGLEVDFGPFTCIAGPNGSGKSNLFDAIGFLALLADHPLMDAAELLRNTERRGGDPKQLFWSDGQARSDRMRFAAEMLVPRTVEDDFGRRADATITFLRYELELGYEPPSRLASLGRLTLLHEELRHIKIGEAHTHLRFPHSAKDFRREVVTGRRAGKAFISTTESEDDQLVIQVHQDGGSRGQPRPSPAKTAPRTIVSTTTTSSDPTILAARREFQSWRTLALEPAAMRSPDPFTADPHVASSGAHLAATLYRLAAAPHDDLEPDDVYATVAAQLGQLLDVQELRVDRDDRRELLTLELRERGGAFLSSRSLSDGTLRFLALCLIGVDPETRGLLCLEEPENGIHPARLEAMVELVAGLAVDATRAPGVENVLRQVIVNTHSPYFVRLQDPRDLLFARPARVRSSKGRPASTLRLRPLRDTWRCGDSESGVGLSEVLAFLTAPPGSQLSLPSEFDSIRAAG